MFDAVKKLFEPKDNYERLFDCEETRLAQGTGSHLLDAFLRIVEPNVPSQLGAIS